MKMPAFTALALTAAMMMTSGLALAEGANDGPSQGEANAAELKEGVGKAFSFLRAVGGLAVDAAKDGALAARAKAAAAQAAVEARQVQDEGLAGAASAPEAAPGQQGMSEGRSRPSGLAQKALDMAKTHGGKMALGVAGHIIPGGEAAVSLGAKAIEARARADAKPSPAPTAPPGEGHGGLASPAAVAGAIGNPLGGLFKAGGALLGKIQARRDATAAAEGSSAPAQQNKL